MKIAFLIGVNDVGGAEFVSYHHVLMAYSNGMDVTVLSGTTGKFYDLIKAAGIRIEIVTMNPAPEIVSGLLQGCDVVFNCNFFAITPTVIDLKKCLGFRYLAIIHSNINWVYNQLIKYDDDTSGYYAIHHKIVDTFVGYGYMNRQKFSVIPNCVDVDLIRNLSGERENARLTFGFNKGDFVIGMISRVAADKNIIDAVRILTKLPASINATLLIVGGVCASAASESYYGRLKRLIQTIGVGKFQHRVIITGNLATEDVYKTMQAFDIGLNCSPSEGLPIALLEMMGAGIPCVMPGIGDIPDVLTCRGIVVPIRQRLEIKEILAEPCYSPEEIELFVQAINKLYQHPKDRERMGNVAAHYVGEFRSLKFQEKLFIKFLDMAKKTKAANTKELPIQKENIDMVGEEIPLIVSALELPMVSVLMPIRDGNAEWIELAIKSIFEQNYAGKIELVVANHDCRLSLSEKIEAILLKKPDGMYLRYLRLTDTDLQFSEVLDLGVAECSGEIIVRMDCDDIAELNLLTELVDFMQEHKDIDVCGVQVRFFGAKSMTTSHTHQVTRESAFQSPGTWFINHPGVAMRKAALLKVGGYGKTKTGFAEDYHLWCKILKSGGVIANLPDVLLNYRCYQKEWRYPEGYAEFLQKEKAGLRGE